MIVYWDGMFFVGGFIYFFVDMLVCDDNGEVLIGFCDFNLLLGKGVSNDKFVCVIIKV